MRALLDDPPVLQDDDQVGLLHGRDPMRDEERRPGAEHVTQTIQDLPLIQSRMQIIEHLASDSMDEVNYDAFAEAYKDLSNMVKKLGSNR